MKRLWLGFMPLLYLPNFGLAERTQYGELEMCDYLIGPYILLLLFASGPKARSLATELKWPLVVFLSWALLSSMTIIPRYDYVTDYYMRFSLLKIAKLTLYLLAAVLTVRALGDERARQLFPWTLLAAGVIVGIALLQKTTPEPIVFAGNRPQLAYKAGNAVSVMMAMLLTFLVAQIIDRETTTKWRRVAWFLLPAMVAGFLVSEGRGGWVAALAGIAFLLYRRGLRRFVLTAVTVLSLTTWGAYEQFPEFRKQLHTALNPDDTVENGYQTMALSGYDAGRLTNWTHEAQKLLSAPLLGTGFYHRGGASRLWPTGSHNYWLQMFLETGIVGGLSILYLLGGAWRQALGAGDVRVQSVLVVAFVGGMSGEYFYGGMVLFTLVVLYGTLGSRPLSSGVAAHPSPALRLAPSSQAG